MAIYHFEAKVISRGNGRSACAASAYMSCSRIYNEYDGAQHDYTRKHGLVWEQVFLPENAPAEWQNREALWNAVEKEERSRDSRLAREFVVALPTELDQNAWIDILTQFIQSQLVDEGMCVDAVIHDTDGHNPHAHIMMTVRPLTDKGTWRKKTEKEYICIKGDEERAFTSMEFMAAQADGWEKQYQYIVDGKKKYLPPSEAELHGYNRADKHPKSTRYGRQDPLTAKWNSDDQLLSWRKSWADSVNKALKEHGIEEHIDHRSFKELGITEQPTIHEGYIARNLEKQGIISDRCEINREIRKDNMLLKELKKQVQKLTKVVFGSIPKVAEMLETMRGNMIRLWYHLLHNSMQQNDLTLRINAARPIMDKYQTVKKQIKLKQDDKKELVQQKKETGVLKPIQIIRLNQQITSLTEEIEELRSHKSQLISDLYCHSDKEMTEYSKYLDRMSNQLDKLEKQRDSLLSEIDTYSQKFSEVRSRIPSDKELLLMDSRLMIRDRIQNNTIDTLKDTFGNQFDYARFTRASDHTDERLGEDPEFFRHRGMELSRKLSAERQAQQPVRKAARSIDLER